MATRILPVQVRSNAAAPRPKRIFFEAEQLLPLLVEGSSILQLVASELEATCNLMINIKAFRNSTFNV